MCQKIGFPLYGWTVNACHNPVYFTLSDANFSPRTLAMIKSLKSFDSEVRFFFFHFGDLTVNQLNIFREHHVEIYSIRNFLGLPFFDSLSTSRDYIELLWTLPSVISRKLLTILIDSQYTDLVYLDADLFFFSSPTELWDEIPSHNISIVRHNFPVRLKTQFPHSGEFNVSWVSFPTSTIGIECATDWANNCIRMCPATPTILNGKVVYGDQLYLEDWPSRFSGHLHVIEHPGAGVAPWNYEKYQLTKIAPFLVDSLPLIFYHFSSHQFGFFLARKMGTTYSAVSPIPAEIYNYYENFLLEASLELGFDKWKSRFEPAYTRFYKNLMRRFKRSMQLKVINKLSDA